MATFGVSVVKLKMLRPLLGSPSTASTPSRVADRGLVTSIIGSAATVISSQLHHLRRQREVGAPPSRPAGAARGTRWSSLEPERPGA